jgi:DNA-binding ferritin-like protein (Dps family)
LSTWIVEENSKRRPLHDSVRKRFNTISQEYANDWRALSLAMSSAAGLQISAGMTVEHTHAGPRDGHAPRLQPRTEGRTSMFTSKQYRDKAAEYKHLTDTALTLNEKREYQNLEQRFTTLADNEQWMVDHREQTVHAQADCAGEEPATLPGLPETIEISAPPIPCGA